MAAKNETTPVKSFVRMTPESEAKDAVRLFNEGLKTLACACSIYEEWTENTDPYAPDEKHPGYLQIVRTYNGKPVPTYRNLTWRVFCLYQSKTKLSHLYSLFPPLF